MSTIKSSDSVKIDIAGTTIFTANSSGVSITGSLNSTTPVVSASYATTASYALSSPGGGGVSKGFVIAMATAL